MPDDKSKVAEPDGNRVASDQDGEPSVEKYGLIQEEVRGLDDYRERLMRAQFAAIATFFI